MAAPTDERPTDTEVPETRGTIRDRRNVPHGVLPRHVQMWLMIAIAVVILAIILMTGQSTPSPRTPSGARLAEPRLVSPERVRSYEQTLAAEAARQQSAAAQEQAAVTPRLSAGGGPQASQDPFTDEQRRREYQSLFADNVVLSRRPTERQSYNEREQTNRVEPPPEVPTPLDLPLLQQLLSQGPRPPARAGIGSAVPFAPPTASLAPPSSAPVETTPRTASVSPVATPASATGPIVTGGPITKLLEGTVIETVLLNRLDGTFAGPVTCLVTTPVYSHDRQAIVIPAGARVLGSSSPVQTWGESRLAVVFHRLVMPDGRTHSLDGFKGLSQIGDTGLKDSVNRHYWQVFGASLAIGALSGLAQYSSRTSDQFGDAYRQSAGSSLAASTGRVLDRYLNILPTITIREGYRIKVYLTNDLELPVHATIHGGVQ